ncbi:MAG: dTDP-4-dehydrorhamnose reductase [Candidatus Omnitrophota bacterium]
MVKILVTGSAGMLAADIVPVLLKDGHEVIQTDINQRLPDIETLDVTDPEEVMKKVSEVAPDYIFHLAAETNVDLCEEDPDHAYKVNAIGTENIVKACKRAGVRLLYISTGAAFDGGKDTPYTEFDQTGPVSVYGKSKLEGEEIVQKELEKYVIIRAGWMVGGWELDKKFVYKIVQQLKQGKRDLMAVSDKFGAPTFTKDFAKNLMNVINTEKYGIYHMANKGTCSRYDMAVKIVEFMGLADEATVEAVDSSRFPLPAPRARSEMIDNHKLEEVGLNNMPRWEESLEEYIKENKDK